MCLKEPSDCSNGRPGMVLRLEIRVRIQQGGRSFSLFGRAGSCGPQVLSAAFCESETQTSQTMALSLTARKLGPCLSLQASLARHSESAPHVLPFVPNFNGQLRFRWPATFQKHGVQSRRLFSQEAATARPGVVQAVLAGEVIDVKAEAVLSQVRASSL